MHLKNYQRRTLEVLESYLDAVARTNNPEEEFRKIHEPPFKSRNQPYLRKWGDIDELEGVPYVCIRIPTGGGKTLLASYAAGYAAKLSGLDTTIVLWLVPSNVIERQTIEALKKRGHPYREALDKAFGGRVAVFGADEIYQIRVKDLEEKTCIVVLTIQTLRIDEEKSDKRNIYRSFEDFAPHFSLLPCDLPGLMRDFDGNTLYSFVNMLYCLRPVVIIDEAHKAVSKLSGEMMARIHPSCVIEFTATPVESNILWSVHPSDLKREEMVKLPFILTEYPDWQSAVSGAVMERKRLEEIAKKDVEYIRPIALFQAQDKVKEASVDVLKKHLEEHENIPPEQIAIATGSQRELDGLDLFDPGCQVRYILTVQALKEGWDCSLAYVFCSVANVKSAIDVEQFLGRVMRMPYAKSRTLPELNKAYAHVVSPSFQEAAEAMAGHLTNMGFNREDAPQYIKPARILPEEHFLPFPVTIVLGKDAAIGILESTLTEEEKGKVRISPKANGGFTLEVDGGISPRLHEKLISAAPEDEREDVEKTLSFRTASSGGRSAAPSERGVVFAMPKLCYAYEQRDFLMPLDNSDGLFASEAWNLEPSEGLFENGEFSYDPRTRTFEFDVNSENMLQFKALENRATLWLSGFSQDWNETRLCEWLCETLKENDLEFSALGSFVLKGVDSLLRQGLSLAELLPAKRALAYAFKSKIARSREKAIRREYQRALFENEEHVHTCFEYSLTFDHESYPVHRERYEGAYGFQRHFHPVVVDLQAKGKEYECAKIIDRNPDVAFWLRNPSKWDGSFRLLLSSGQHFYPDFIGRLRDSRVFAIEYKGKFLESADDAKEKDLIGRLWARRSNGRAIFLMATSGDERGRTTERQIQEALRR